MFYYILDTYMSPKGFGWDYFDFLYPKFIVNIMRLPYLPKSFAFLVHNLLIFYTVGLLSFAETANRAQN